MADATRKPAQPGTPEMRPGEQTREAGASRGRAARRSKAGVEAAGAPPTIRLVATWSEYEACVALQHEVWGTAFTESVPAAILMVAQRIGGVVAGAFEPDGRLSGFVFGMTGTENGRLVHWSDMLAVRADARGQGTGRRLKMFQRETARARGVSTMYWTFDPLVARNAHLNLVTLHAHVIEYVQDMYGRETSSVLHKGLGSDRFLVAWDVGAADLPVHDDPDAIDPPAGTVPLLNNNPLVGAGHPAVRVAVPLHIDRVQRHSLIVAGRWRADTRRAFAWSFAQGYRVSSFHRDEASDTGVYVLRHADAADAADAF